MAILFLYNNPIVNEPIGNNIMMTLEQRMAKAVEPNYEVLNTFASIMPVEIVEHFEGKPLEFTDFLISATMQARPELDASDVYDMFHYKGAFNDLKNAIYDQLEQDASLRGDI